MVGGTILLSRGQSCNFFLRFTDTEGNDQTEQDWNQRAAVAQSRQAVQEKQKLKCDGFV